MMVAMASTQHGERLRVGLVEHVGLFRLTPFGILDKRKF